MSTYGGRQLEAGEEVVAVLDEGFCPDCGYHQDVHRGADGVYDERACPDETQARDAWVERS